MIILVNITNNCNQSKKIIKKRMCLRWYFSCNKHWRPITASHICFHFSELWQTHFQINPCLRNCCLRIAIRRLASSAILWLLWSPQRGTCDLTSQASRTGTRCSSLMVQCCLPAHLVTLSTQSSVPGGKEARGCFRQVSEVVGLSATQSSSEPRSLKGECGESYTTLWQVAHWTQQPKRELT